MKKLLSIQEKNRGLFLILALGISLCIWELGSTGLVDETPPLFAAASRAMSVTGDWLTPRVNGLPRFDKPPLVYWLMGLMYSLPSQNIWDPLGTWSARLPSAISSVLVMLMLGDTVMRYPQNQDVFPRRTAVVAALAFALSPLVMIWSRIAVSDALLCCTFGISMLFQWRRYVDPKAHSWWLAWLVLGFAVLTKGPVAVVLMGISLILFGLQQRNLSGLCQRVRPLPGLVITALVSLPWYGMELLVEGKPFWNSFFGYHNFQRLTSVVNNHSQPWWFFGLVLIVASLPFTPLLLKGLFEGLFISPQSSKSVWQNKQQSLIAFAACWLLAVFFLFTCAATKLPSYWLPATPASALLIALAAIPSKDGRLGVLLAWGGSILFALTLAIVFWASPLWIVLIKDPEMPTLAKELISSGILFRAAICLTSVTILGLLFAYLPRPGRLLAMQGPLVFFQLIVLLPLWSLSDRIRQLPLRQAAQLLVSSQKTSEPFAMMGVTKPSLHFYTDQIVIYEGRSSRALVNLVDRLKNENRQGQFVGDLNREEAASSALLVIDRKTIQRPYWQGLNPEELGQFGIYKVWRLDRIKLEERANRIIEKGIEPDWRTPRPERF